VNPFSDVNSSASTFSARLVIKEIAEHVSALGLTSGINSQALSNTTLIPLRGPSVQDEVRDSFDDMLRTALRHYAGLLDLSEHPHGLLFYAWVDGQAGQLRMSAISGSFSSPPFGCDCDFGASANDIAMDCLTGGDSLLGPRKKLAVWTRRIQGD
jgi:hypothetical protein